MNDSVLESLATVLTRDATEVRSSFEEREALDDSRRNADLYFFSYPRITFQNRVVMM